MQKQEKQCSLPFRTSPTTKHVRVFSRTPRTRPAPLFTQTITPAESSEEENSPPFASSHEPPSHLSQLTMGSTMQVQHTYDLDMDLIDSLPMASPSLWAQQPPLQTPNASPCTVTPPQPVFRDPLSSPKSASVGRLPTPIYGHFQQSIDAKMDLGEDRVIPQSENEIGYEMYARRKRLPTPIDEDEPMDTSSKPVGVMFRHFAIGNEGHYENHYAVKTSNGFIASPRGAKLSFSMGIRADCDLCRNRVSGHSNHIFRS